MELNAIIDCITNYAVKYVLEELQTMTDERHDICKCKDCMIDYAAVALNNIPPRYHISMLGELEPDISYRELVKYAIENALLKVAQHPHH